MPKTDNQPLITRKMTIRFAIGLLIIAGLVFAYQLFQQRGQDLQGTGSTETGGAVAAIEVLPEGGSQVVLIMPDGNVVRSPDYEEGATDREPEWRPDGNQIFFSSDRPVRQGVQTKAFNIFRWNVARQSLQPMTQGTIARLAPSFAPVDSKGENETLLIISGGNVWELNPRDQRAQRVMPYERESIENLRDESGEPTAATTQSLRVREAKWTKDKRWIAAVARTETGEALYLQNMHGTDEQRGRPALVAAGDRIELAINPKSGEVIYAVQGFQFPDPQNVPEEFVKDGRVVPPFRHYVGILNPDDPQQQQGPIVASEGDEAAFRNPTVSPDGAYLALVVGAYEREGSVAPAQLALMPPQVAGAQRSRVVLRGEIYEPSWAPNSETIAYVKRENGARSIFTINIDGSGERNVTGGKGNFAFPKISPQRR